MDFDPKQYPDEPGVYRMLSAEGRVLYIGKALSLRKRLSQYFQEHRHDGRYQLDLLLPKVNRVEVIVTRDERDALVLENQLIKMEKPRYNIRLKDDKTYPYVRLSKDDFPRVEISRTTGEREYENFGPFVNVGHASKLVELLTCTYGLRRCPPVPLKKLKRPCLYAQIGQCSAPCVDDISREDYADTVAKARKILSGKTGSAIAEAKDSMSIAAENLDYEKAAHWRDVIRALESFQRGALKDSGRRGRIDIFSCVHVRGWMIIAVLGVRDGIFAEAECYQEKALEAWESLFPSFAMEVYNRREIPEMIVSDAGESFDALTDVLSDRAGSPVNIHHPKRGELRNWLVMARQNARAEASCRTTTGGLGVSEEYLEAVRDETGLARVPKRVIALDISHHGGENPVGSVVVFVNGEPDNTLYRHYKLKREAGVEGDARDLGEVLGRYLKRLSPDDVPDAILLDGAKVQLDEGCRVLKEADLEPQGRLMAISKGEGRRSGLESLHMPNQKTRSLEELPVSMRLWTHMRDEAHRYANRLREKRSHQSRLASPFSKLPGIGPKAEKILRATFGTLPRMLNSRPEEVDELKGINKNQKELLKFLITENRKDSDESD